MAVVCLGIVNREKQKTCSIISQRIRLHFSRGVKVFGFEPKRFVPETARSRAGPRDPQEDSKPLSDILGD